MKCKSCGKEIGHVMVHRFTWDGADDESKEEILGGEEDDCYYIDVDTQASMFEFDSDHNESIDDFKDNIWCPECNKYPFKGSVSIYERAHVIFGVNNKNEFE